MHRLSLRACALLVWSFVSAVAHAQLGGPAPPDPTSILAAAKAASGGAAWDALKTQHSKVNIHTAGLAGTAERWSEYATGRSSLVYSIGPVTGAAGFDGKVAWSQDASGQSQVRPPTPRASLPSTLRIATVSPSGILTARPRAGVALRKRQRGWRRFRRDQDSRPTAASFELWINAQTKLIERLVEREAQETRTEVYMDVRELQGVKIPFRVRASRGDPRYDELVVVDAMDFNQPLTGAQFAQPGPPKPDFVFPAGRASVEVPFEFHNGHLFLKVMLNGKGPFRMLFDSGGSNVLFPRALAQIGVKSEGALSGSGAGDGRQDVGVTRVDRLEFGGIVVERQVFATIDLDPLMRRVEGLDDVAGLVGYELFKRFPVKLDYEHSRAIFYDPAKFVRTGARLPILFRGTNHCQGTRRRHRRRIPRDTGSRASRYYLLFVEANDHRQVRLRSWAISGSSASGPVRALFARATLQLSDNTVRLGDVAIVANRGALADRISPAISGFGVLRQFNIVRLRQQSSYLKERELWATGRLRPRWAVGRARRKGLRVVDIVAGGPAAVASIQAAT
jgi:hypothetical protein